MRDAQVARSRVEASSSLDARRFTAELRAEGAEAALDELGAAPLPWADDGSIPPALQASTFEAVAIKVAAEVHSTPPDVDCGEYPCVVRLPPDWAEEDVASFQSRLVAAVDIDDAAVFGHARARVIGIYPESDLERLGRRLWFRTAEIGRELEAERGD